ncbi:MAG: pseudouridylate synthase [Bacteroidales bacterium]|nr:pseudouridylate synthase [Bacteroidales bacterium]
MSAFAPIPASEILPQRPPFLFVDSIVHYDEAAVRTRFLVKEGGMLLEDSRLGAAGLLENMAQSSAARTGYISRFILNIPIRIGYIGAIRGGKIFRLPQVGETIETTVSLVQEIENVTMVDVVVRSGDEILARANLKTALGQEAAL